MSKTYTTEELNTLSGTELNQIILAQQEQINTLQANYEKLIEQIRIANQARFGRHSEKLDVIDGQLSLFDEAEAFSDPEAEEPSGSAYLSRPKKLLNLPRSFLHLGNRSSVETV